MLSLVTAHPRDFLSILPMHALAHFSLAYHKGGPKQGKCIPDHEPTPPELCIGTVHECDDDQDCSGSAKCCLKGCKRRCEPQSK